MRLPTGARATPLRPSAEGSAAVYLFDTNIVSELTKPRANVPVVRRLLACDKRHRNLSEVTRYELRYGTALRQNDPLWTHIETQVVPRFNWLVIDAAVCMRTADIAAGLERSGQRVDWPDLMIAATALVHGLVVVTRNVRHFDRVPGLMVENWFPDER